MVLHLSRPPFGFPIPDEESGAAFAEDAFAEDGLKDRGLNGSEVEQPFKDEGDEEDPHPEQGGTVVFFSDSIAGHSDEGHEEHGYFPQEIIELRRPFGLDPPRHLTRMG